jgi:hypothetical protein
VLALLANPKRALYAVRRTMVTEVDISLCCIFLFSAIPFAIETPFQTCSISTPRKFRCTLGSAFGFPSSEATLPSVSMARIRSHLCVTLHPSRRGDRTGSGTVFVFGQLSTTICKRRPPERYRMSESTTSPSSSSKGPQMRSQEPGDNIIDLWYTCTVDRATPALHDP